MGRVCVGRVCVGRVCGDSVWGGVCGEGVCGGGCVWDECACILAGILLCTSMCARWHALMCLTLENIKVSLAPEKRIQI